MTNIMKIIYILLLFYLTKEVNILPLTISFSMYVLYNSIFSTTGIKNTIDRYDDNYIKNKIFRYSIIFISILGSFLILISYFVGDIINIDKLNIINIFMTLSFVVNIIFKITKEYIFSLGYTKFSNNLANIYDIAVTLISIILSILLFKVFNLEDYINIILLYSVNVMVFVPLIIIIYILVLKNVKKKSNIVKINSFNIKDIIVNNKSLTMFNVINSSYIYTSIIMLYYILTNKYNYSYDSVGMYISNTYFYGLIIIYFIYIIINKFLNINYCNIKDSFINVSNKIVKISLAISILLIIISKSISNILFNEYNIIAILVPVLFVFIIYNYVLNINIKYNREKFIYIVLLIGLLVKIISEIPLINTIYRMGYNLVFGSILSTILGFIVSLIIGLILIKYKFKLNLLDNFNNILNIIYENIIYCLILVLFTLIIKIDTNGILSSVLVILFYIFISIILYILKKKFYKK